MYNGTSQPLWLRGAVFLLLCYIAHNIYLPSKSQHTGLNLIQGTSMNRKTVFKLLFTALFLLFVYWISTYFAAYTDDAYLETDIIRMAPRVEGHIQLIPVKDNQQVNKGDLLAVIDPTPFQINLSSSQARLDQSRSKLAAQKKNLNAAEAIFKESEAALTLAKTTEQRFRKLIKSRTVSQQAYDEKLEAYRKALDKHKEAESEVDEAKASVEAQTHDVRHAQAQLIWLNSKPNTPDCMRQ